MRLQPSHHPDLQQQQYWQRHFDNRLNALGIENIDNAYYSNPPPPDSAPYRYGVYRGKAVPNSNSSGVHLPSTHDQLSSHPRAQNQAAQGRQPVSSIYPGSDHSHSDAHLANQATSAVDMYASYQYGQRPEPLEQVSPPSSPEMNPRERYLDHNVSPIDDDDEQRYRRFPRGGRYTDPAQESQQPPLQQTYPQPAHQPKSSIPKMRRERRKQDIAAASSREVETGHRTRSSAIPANTREPQAFGWEPPTAPGMNSGGRSSPGYLEDGRQSPMGMTTTTIYSQTARPRPESPSLGQRMRQLGRGHKAEPIETRPAWNGASGRQTIVSPVRDDTNAAPLKVPPRSSKRLERPRAASTEHETLHNSRNPAPSGARRFFSPKQGIDADLRGKSSPYGRSATQNAAQSYPSPSSTNSPAESPYQPGPSPPAATSPSPLSIPSSDKAIKRKPPATATHLAKPSTSSSIYPTYPEPQNPEFVPRPLNTTRYPDTAFNEPQVQPPSRFSITTYATSAPASPRQSDEEERPPIPEQPAVPSVMDRRRPICGRDSDSRGSGNAEPIKISLRSASISTPFTGMAQETFRASPLGEVKEKSSRPSSILSTTKALPPAPPEVDSTKNRVELLSAKIEGLAHRRLNITRSIAQMTELMPQDRLLASEEVLRRREDEKKKVERLKEELAEVQQEEYELGIKLHRAYKRQERESEWESGSLWVKRAVGV